MAAFTIECPNCKKQGEIILRGMPVMSYCAFIKDKNLPAYLAAFRGYDVRIAHPHSRYCALTDDQWAIVHPLIARNS